MGLSDTIFDNAMQLLEDIFEHYPSDLASEKEEICLLLAAVIQTTQKLDGFLKERVSHADALATAKSIYKDFLIEKFGLNL